MHVHSSHISLYPSQRKCHSLHKHLKIMVSILPRISAEDQKIDYNALKETARKHFIQHKVDISDAIKKVFPFLEILRDRGFITDKIYKVSEAYFVTSW